MQNIKHIILSLIIVMSISLAFFGCKEKADGVTEQLQSGSQSTADLIVIGFSQVGAESVWRNVNTESMKETFTEEKGYRLIFEDGQQKQSNQIMAIRKFIQQEVDYIVLAPVTETGWDTVLMEAKEAGIPVIIVDRMVDVSDDSLYTCWVGSNFELEGEKLCTWIHDYYEMNNLKFSNFNIVNIQGNHGATAQIGRTEGLRKAASKYGWNILRQSPADFTRTKAKEVMKEFMKDYKSIHVVYCENDSMALGAIDALEEAGKKVGTNIKTGDIMVVSFDGVDEEAQKFVLDGKISCIAECNPLHGPRVENIIRAIESGESPEKYTYVDESLYSSYPGISKLQIDGAYYEVTIVE